ncbi:MAG: four helix bundle protein [Anaerolineae bacterium]|nr:four helix bundle protein [Anaerolineae bacterium]
MQDFKKLIVWQKSHQLTLEIYKLTGEFPKQEAFGLTSQMRRAAASVPTNIAEGSGRGTSSELARFLDIASGSICELEYQLILAHDLKYIALSSYEKIDNDLQEVKRMLAGFIRTIRSS